MIIYSGKYNKRFVTNQIVPRHRRSFDNDVWWGSFQSYGGVQMVSMSEMPIKTHQKDDKNLGQFHMMTCICSTLLLDHRCGTLSFASLYKIDTHADNAPSRLTP